VLDATNQGHDRLANRLQRGGRPPGPGASPEVPVFHNLLADAPVTTGQPRHRGGPAGPAGQSRLELHKHLLALQKNPALVPHFFVDGIDLLADYRNLSRHTLALWTAAARHGKVAAGAVHDPRTLLGTPTGRRMMEAAGSLLLMHFPTGQAATVLSDLKPYLATLGAEEFRTGRDRVSPRLFARLRPQLLTDLRAGEGILLESRAGLPRATTVYIDCGGLCPLETHDNGSRQIETGYPNERGISKSKAPATLAPGSYSLREHPKTSHRPPRSSVGLRV
jgi:hypothetical protein